MLLDCAIDTRERRVGRKATTAKVAHFFSFAVALFGREYKRTTEDFSRGETEPPPPQKKVITALGFATAEDRGRNRKEAYKLDVSFIRAKKLLLPIFAT